VWISSNRKALARPQDHPGFSRKLYEVGFVEGASAKLLRRLEFDLIAQRPLTHGSDLTKG
jgi:Fe2+ transport system protein FeoA